MSKVNKKLDTWIEKWLFPGIGLVVAFIVAFFADLMIEDLEKPLKITYVIIAVAIYLIIIAVCAGITAICSAKTKDKEIAKSVDGIEKALETFKNTGNELSNINKSLEQHSEQTNKHIKKLEEYSNKLEKNVVSLVKTNDLLQYILDGKSVINLEESVGNTNEKTDNLEIYIQSSTFILEQSDLKEAIIWNLRKGVTYKYMIPSNMISNYETMIHRWYCDFSIFLRSKKEYNTFIEKYNSEENIKYKGYWSESYSKLVKKAGEYWENPKSPEILEKLKEDCQKLFQRRIKTCVEDPSMFYVTVALYEIEADVWEAIIKLPTQNPKEKYYAFKVPEGKEKNNFINQFKVLFQFTKNYEENNPSTYGGKIELNYKEIFVVDN